MCLPYLRLFKISELALFPQFLVDQLREISLLVWTFTAWGRLRWPQSDAVVPHLLSALLENAQQQQQPQTQWVDLCAEKSPYSIAVQRSMTAKYNRSCNLVLASRLPRVEAWQALQDRTRRDHHKNSINSDLEYLPYAVRAVDVPAGLPSFRTLFSRFHDFVWDQQRAVLQDAVRKRAGIAVFETTSRSLLSLVVQFWAAVLYALLSALVQPGLVRWLFLPVLVPVFAWDTLVACLRTRTEAELRRLVSQVQGHDGYVWRIGQQRCAAGTTTVAFLIGTPRPPAQVEGNGAGAEGQPRLAA